MNIRVLRQKIKSVGNVQKITKAMQLVSAVKMKKAVAAALEGKPYQEILERMIAKLQEKINPELSPFLSESETNETSELMILVSTNKGLCGAFNSNLYRFLINNDSMLKNTDFIIIGKKGASFANRAGRHISADFSTDHPDEIVSATIQMAVSEFLEGKYKRVLVAYNAFISTVRTEPTLDVLLPVALKAPEEEKEEKNAEYLIEPDPQEMIESLLRSYIEERLRYILTQTEAGEHATRMMAMKNATDNAKDIIYNLTLQRNKLRQQKITYELLDMITAKESVEVN